MNLIEMKVFSEYKHDLMNIMENIWCFWSIWGIFLKGGVYREPHDLSYFDVKYLDNE